jgi:hypothetical protein
VQTIRAINVSATPLTGIDIASADLGDVAERDTCTGAAPCRVQRMPFIL